ncbi:hypothetical protein CJ030_MR7G008237 [Morella rubra]|uniref:Uncharacterized protein n=1 Tax=Morella rubra TaxID=262757 RepID=A0A6A1V6M9_9ROSI|nr:hypothetical protein CJ030_MR7G008244 [Morella rubra]KAB1206847.1 hypothetical protein CJ030_MR7G008237 [Morella rubra]
MSIPTKASPATKKAFTFKSLDLALSHKRAGQYLQLRVPDAAKPSFLAIVSLPFFSATRGAFEFLVRSMAGQGFDIDQIEPPKAYPTVLIFCSST